MSVTDADGHVIWLADCTGDCAGAVGGKATGLGALMREGLQVPDGFAITTIAYREHIEHNRMAADLQRLVANCTGYAEQQNAAEEIFKLFEASEASPGVQAEVLRAYTRLCGTGDVPVAVRSSATAEDMATASFAGQQETYLSILGGEQVLRHVMRCWSSLFTAQAIAYRAHLPTPVTDLAMGVVVQHMVPADVAGVTMTLDPITGDRSCIVIEASYGLGAAVVNGEVTPDHVCVDKESLAIRSRTIGMKNFAYRFDPTGSGGQGTRRDPVPTQLQSKPCLTDEEIVQIAALGKQMEQAMGRPQDIEWAVGPGPNGAREVYLLQARPETIWSSRV